jgi:hypothetical protein
VIQKSKLIGGLFIFQFVLSCIELMLILFSPYRNKLGVIRSNTDWIFTLSPPIYVVIACGACLYLYLNDKKYSRVIIYILTILFIIGTIMSFIPWAGIFFVLLTPVSVLYYGALLLPKQHAYSAMMIVLGLYLMQNIIIMIKLKRKNIG